MENTPQQPNYFRFSDAPLQTEVPKPWFRRPEVLKRLTMIAVAILVLGFGGVFVVNFVKNISGSGPKSEIEAAKDEVVQRQEDCNEDDEACKAHAQTAVARTAGVAEACEGLTEGELENCVTLVALQKKDTSSCASLEKDAERSCKDSVLLARAEGGEGMSMCDDIENASKKNSCQALVTSTARTTGDCAKYGVEESVCDKQSTLLALLQSGNYAGCAELPQEEREECQDLFSSTDADTDGLTAKEEAEIGTSDQNTDTDGDGYSDGTEVAAGYNPLN